MKKAVKMIYEIYKVGWQELTLSAIAVIITIIFHILSKKV